MLLLISIITQNKFIRVLTKCIIQISEFWLILIRGAILGQKTANFSKNQGPVGIWKVCVYSYELALNELSGRLESKWKGYLLSSPLSNQMPTHLSIFMSLGPNSHKKERNWVESRLYTFWQQKGGSVIWLLITCFQRNRYPLSP